MNSIKKYIITPIINNHVAKCDSCSGILPSDYDEYQYNLFIDNNHEYLISRFPYPEPIVNNNFDNGHKMISLGLMSLTFYACILRKRNLKLF
jgi:hypothetical protein